MVWKNAETDPPKYTGTYLATCSMASEFGGFYDVLTVKYHIQRFGNSNQFEGKWIYPRQTFHDTSFSVLYWTDVPFPAMRLYNEFDGYVEDLDVKFPETDK